MAGKSVELKFYAMGADAHCPPSRTKIKENMPILLLVHEGGHWASAPTA